MWRIIRVLRKSSCALETNVTREECSQSLSRISIECSTLRLALVIARLLTSSIEKRPKLETEGTHNVADVATGEAT